jgi:ABC-type multidrug transport system ATPase subunit
VLDEPTTGVDAVSRLEFWDMLKRLKNSGITIVVATPYMDEASLCDRVALIQDGKLMTISTPSEVIKTYPRELYSVKSDDIYRMLNDLRKFPGVHSVFAFGQAAHVSFKNDGTEEDAIRLYLENKGHTGIVVSPAIANIEDCFMELMIRI